MGHQWGTEAAKEHGPPRWVGRLLVEPQISAFDIDGITSAVVQATRHCSLISVRVAQADGLSPLAFQRQTVAAYRGIRRVLMESGAHPLRFWNFIPDIGKRIGESLSRYMVFNAGRYAAFLDWYGDSRTLGLRVATASGVGHRGADLVIHCLSSSAGGVAIENPRQISSYSYSSRYGPLPPTFARATAWNVPGEGESTLLIGGTASIRGEHSLHVGDLRRQTMETLENLAAVIKSGRMAAVATDRHGGEGNGSIASWLRHLRCMRVYHVRGEDRDAIDAMLVQHCRVIRDIEWIQADLCRPELLVEIEGVAHQPAVCDESLAMPQLMQREFLGA